LRFLIVNQHTSNHGDEAAGKALLRALDKENDIEQVDILYNAPRKMFEDDKLTLKSALQITHYLPTVLSYLDKALIRTSFLLPLPLIRILLRISPLKQEFKLIESADIVINAPGGVNIGPYKDWQYLWRLYISVKLDKPLAIYSISFGPIPKNRLFKFVSLYVLRNSEFLSLRDKQSQTYAEEYNLKHIPSIDTAFLDNTFSKDLPTEINNIKERKYVVVVPNDLYSWHPCYRNLSKKYLDNIYLSIINLFTSKGLNVVLLPQLFGIQNDSRYFERLCLQLPNKKNVCIIPADYNCDMQQAVVNKAEFLVGARYHSIVFAIRGNTPFIALSYEHKAKHMLSLLSLDRYAVDLEQVLDQDFSSELVEKIEACSHNCETIKQELSLAKNKANDIAQKTFSAFKQFLKDVTTWNSQKSA